MIDRGCTEVGADVPPSAARALAKETDEADVLCVGCRSEQGRPCRATCQVDAMIKRLEATPSLGKDTP